MLKWIALLIASGFIWRLGNWLADFFVKCFKLAKATPKPNC